MPRNMLVNFPQLLADVNRVVLATEMTLASARDTIRILSWLRAHASHAQVLVVANKVQPALSEISKSDFEASIERKIDLSIPYDLKGASNAAKLGQTFAEANRTTKAGAVLRELAEMVIGASDGTEAAVPAASKKALLSKFDFKTMLVKKDKAPAKTTTKGTAGR
jgi:pilus assembly protein CpaE